MFRSNRRDGEQLHSLETVCQENWGISVVTYRFVKATTEMLGVLLVGGMWAYGSLPPQIAAPIIGGVIFGAEWFETFLERQGAEQNKDAN